jgi:hypothetical protein
MGSIAAANVPDHNLAARRSRIVTSETPAFPVVPRGGGASANRRDQRNVARCICALRSVSERPDPAPEMSKRAEARDRHGRSEQQMNIFIWAAMNNK